MGSYNPGGGPASGTDTLQTVTNRGDTTTNDVEVTGTGTFQSPLTAQTTPSHTFTGTADLGIGGFNDGANDFLQGIVDGTEYMSLGTLISFFRFPVQVAIAGGSAAAPHHSFQGDSDSGMFRITTNQVGISAGGALQLLISTTEVRVIGQGQVSDGTAAEPGWSFSSDVDTGVYRITTNTLGFSTAGVERLRLNATALDMSVDLLRSGVQVVTSRQTGWTAATGTTDRTTFVTGSVTLSELAERVKALIDDLIAHGLIGA